MSGSASIRVAVNGYGVIGKRVAAAVPPFTYGGTWPTAPVLVL